MNQFDILFEGINENTSCSFVFYKLTMDENNSPLDYEYLAVSPAFELFTGLKKDVLIGKPSKQIVGNRLNDVFDWLSFYHDADKHGSASATEQYSTVFNKWFNINAVSMKSGYSFAMINDISGIKQNDLYHTHSQPDMHKEKKEYNKPLVRFKNYRSYNMVNPFIHTDEANEKDLNYRAYHDSLTNLPNRALFFDRLDIAIKLSARSNTKVAVAFIDLDNFKNINDSMGHIAGDDLLRMVADRLIDRIRKYDTLARYGGDEFAVVLQGITYDEQIQHSIDRLHFCFSEPFFIEGNALNIGASIGVSVFPKDDARPLELLKNADTAMYKAKAMGKGGIQYFDKSMKNELVKKEMIEKALKDAIENNEFMLYYQPQYELDTETIRGFEVLIRWKNEGMGFVNPVDFIPVAEDTGLIMPIGEWILKTACLQLKNWYDRFNYTGMISINISTAQLLNKSFYPMVCHIFAETEIDPTKIEFEITEKLFSSSIDTTAYILKELSKLGIKIALDDFGLGYASLNYLKHIPLNTLKIDGSYIKELGWHSKEKHITQELISLVHKLKIETIAEGVETKEQLECLIDANCDNVQGFLVGKPMPQEQVMSFLKEGINLADIR